MARQNPIYLDKIERKFLAQMKAINPAYADLEIDQIAHLELKTRLQEVLRQNLNNQRQATLQHAPVV